MLVAEKGQTKEGDGEYRIMAAQDIKRIIDKQNVPKEYRMCGESDKTIERSR